MMDAQRLRDAVQTLRRTPMPLADMIPLLQQAADEIDRLRAEIADHIRRSDSMEAELEGLRTEVAEWRSLAEAALSAQEGKA